MICAAVTEESVDSMVEAAINCGCEIVELRLDYLREPLDAGKFLEIDKKLIATCMPSWEGGRFTGSEKERVGVLEEALGFCDYVTLELKTEAVLRDALVCKAKESCVKVIIASHDFEKTPAPDVIRSVIVEEESCGADIAKIAFTPKSGEDVLKTLHPILAGPQKIPLIAVAMGEIGKPSRILAPLLGSYLTYGFVEAGKASAPGQLSSKVLERILGGMR